MLEGTNGWESGGEHGLATALVTGRGCFGHARLELPTDATYRSGMLKYFHARRSPLTIDSVLKAGGASSRSTRRIQWIDSAFDQAAPLGSPLRQDCLYAFDGIAACIAYADSVGGGGWNYYEVSLGQPVAKAPWCLTTAAARLGRGHAELQAVAAEYWSPSHPWEFWEYLSDEMIVLADVSGSVPQNAMTRLLQSMSARTALEKDARLAKRLWS